jgi:hypothetical protein
LVSRSSPARTRSVTLKPSGKCVAVSSTLVGHGGTLIALTRLRPYTRLADGLQE